MAQLKIEADGSLWLTSKWWYADTDGDGDYELTGGPTEDAKSITFNYKLPKGAKVKSAKVHSVWSYPLGGFAKKTVENKSIDSDGFVDITSGFDASATSELVTFKFKSGGTGSTSTSSGQRTGQTEITEIYLLIEYTAASIVYLGENGVLVPYEVYHGENGELVPYMIFYGENGQLVQY